MGKTVIRASDGPGFLVNRSNRPFGLEALRLLQERIADVETIDRICRMQGGFRMGPFELMDLVGVDVGFEISKSFYEQSFGEPRWRPSPIAARYVAAGLHGRKTKRGYYSYERRRPAERPGAPPAGPRRRARPSARRRGEGVVVIAGSGVLAEELRHDAAQAGYEVRSPHDPTGGVLPALIVECDRAPAARARGAGDGPREPHAHAPTQGGAHLVLCQAGSLAALDPDGSAVGFHVLAPLEQARLVELTRNDSSSPLAAARAERFFAALGKHVAWVGDAPGLVLGQDRLPGDQRVRVLARRRRRQREGHRHGHGARPELSAGPAEVGRRARASTTCWRCSRRCAREYREERYRPAPALRRLVAPGVWDARRARASSSTTATAERRPHVRGAPAVLRT